MAKRVKILIIGDVIYDQFVYGKVTRLSKEAPVPILDIAHAMFGYGGAGNVAQNVSTLSADPILLSVVGPDVYGQALKAAYPLLIVEPTRVTSVKTRFVADHSQYSTHLLRADQETATPISIESQNELIELYRKYLPEVDVVVISDYAKGVCTDAILHDVIGEAKAAGKFVIVDPKRRDWSAYRGATLITPNEEEFNQSSDFANHNLFTYILVTRGENGMMLFVPGLEVIAIPAEPVQVADVSGAGDTVVAMMARLMTLNVLDMKTAAEWANVAGALAVSKKGTSVVHMDEVMAYRWRKEGHTIALTNGCFDKLHTGHIRVLEEAQKAASKVVVLVNSDASVKRLKGDDRPVNDQNVRTENIQKLGMADMVEIFEEDTPIEHIRRIKPDIIVKGGDYEAEKVVGHDFVKDVIIVPLVDKIPVDTKDLKEEELLTYSK